MKNQPNNRQKTPAGTDVNEVRQRNAASAAGQNPAFGTEFGAETDAQQVRERNAQSEARKNQQAPRNQ